MNVSIVCPSRASRCNNMKYIKKKEVNKIKWQWMRQMQVEEDSHETLGVILLLHICTLCRIHCHFVDIYLKSPRTSQTLEAEEKKQLEAG